MVRLLVRGNSKLGSVVHFSLPPRHTCPGSTEFCDRYCYATKGWFTLNRGVLEALYYNEGASREHDFKARVLSELRELSPVPSVRLHVSGDFYSESYIRKWVEIVTSCAGTMFYAYTRSWRVASLCNSLASLGSLPNVCLFASVDFTHSDRPVGWRTFSVVDGEGVRCPHDTGKVDHCDSCGLCWSSAVDKIWTKLRWSKRWANLSPLLITSDCYRS